jgi:hypothetical protein
VLFSAISICFGHFNTEHGGLKTPGYDIKVPFAGNEDAQVLMPALE